MSQKGSVVHPVHGDRVRKRSPLEQPVADAGEIGSAAVEAAARQVFEEDGMTAWLHYQIGDDDGDLYRKLPTAGGGHVPADRGHALTVEKQGTGVSIESSRVVESSETPADGQAVVMGSRRGPAKANAGGDGRKRKAMEGDDSEWQSEDAEFESGDKRKDAHRSASIRRSGAAEIHNLAERRRRDRIKEKMKTLRDLIPSCNKSDKASMLDEAIEYLKSLQLQVQMMSVGCNTGPAIFPTSNSGCIHSANISQIPHIGDPYCHFLHHLSGSSQSCAMDEPGTSKGINAAESNKLGWNIEPFVDFYLLNQLTLKMDRHNLLELTRDDY